MSEYPRKKFIFFDHIAKAGGTSLSGAINKMFDSNFIAPSIVNKHSDLLKRFHQDKVISCHTWFTPLEKLDSNYFYCTVLRDPVDRFISQYYFNIESAKILLDRGLYSDPRLRDPQVIGANHLSLDDYLKSEIIELKNSFTNVQAVHFAERMCFDPRALSDAELLDAAISSLEEYDLVGFFENLDNFIHQISKYFSLIPPPIPHSNITVSKPPLENLPAGVIEKLQTANIVDRKLIEWAKQRFGGGKIKTLAGANITNSSKLKNSIELAEIFDSKKDVRSKGFGNRKIIITNVYSDANKILRSGEYFRLIIECKSYVDEDNLTVGIAIFDVAHKMLYGVNTQYLNGPIKVCSGEHYKFYYAFDVNLTLGEYSLTVALHTGFDHQNCCYHWIDDAYKFAVAGYGDVAFGGIFNLDADFSLEKLNGQ